MEGFSIIIMLLVLLVLIGVLVYVLRDYYLHKEENAADLDTTKRSLQTEKTDRLGNLKYVVDQVNTVNEDIYNTFTKSTSQQSSNLSTLNTQYSNTLSGLDAFVRFSSNEPVMQSTGGAFSPPPPSFSILNLPGAPGANAELMRHTSFMGGMTARDLAPGGGRTAARFCAPPSAPGVAPKCLEFPSADGHTYLTPLVDGKGIQLDGPTAVIGGLSLYQTLSETTAGGAASAPMLSAQPEKSLSVQANRTAFGGENYAPGATVEIRGASSADPLLRVSTANNASEAIMVSANGDVTVSKLVLKAPGAPNGSVGATLTADPTTGGVNITGDLSVSGKLTVAGEAIFKKITYDPATSTVPAFPTNTTQVTAPITLSA